MNLSEQLQKNGHDVTRILYIKFIYLTRSRNIPPVSFEFFISHQYTCIQILQSLKLPKVQINTKAQILLGQLDWCQMAFDDAFIWDSDSLYFEKEEQVSLFYLRWDRNECQL